MYVEVYASVRAWYADAMWYARFGCFGVGNGRFASDAEDHEGEIC